MLYRGTMIEVQYKRDRTTLGNFANVSEKGIAHKIMFAGMDGNNRRSICRFCFIHDCAKETVCLLYTSPR